VIPSNNIRYANTKSHYQQGNLTATLEWMLRGGVTSVREMGGDVIMITTYSQFAIIPYYPSPRIYPSALVGSWEFMKDPRVIDAAHGFVPGSVPKIC
jgi:hypothetical protein